VMIEEHLSLAKQRINESEGESEWERKLPR
jgi:hypothetical protein